MTIRHAIDINTLARLAGLAFLVGLVLISYARTIFGPRRR